MRDYFIRRFLLIPPTLLGISMVVFAITRLAPGGPVEQAMMQMQQVSEDRGGVGGGRGDTDQAISEEQKKQLERRYGYDKPIWKAYLIWLGVAPMEKNFKEFKFDENATEVSERIRIPRFHVAALDWDGDGFVYRDEVPDHVARYVKFDRLDTDGNGLIDGYEADANEAIIGRARERVNLKMGGEDSVIITNYDSLLGNWNVRMQERDPKKPNAPDVAELFTLRYSGVFQGDLGESFRYGEPALEVILDRLPVSTYFGLLTFFVTYLVCIPLGIIKAVKHNTWVDDASSILIFVGYAVPSYALGALLLLYFSVTLDWLPMGGLTSEGFEELSTWEKFKDLAAHTFQPLCCYLVGGFAFVTMLMKNHLMDNLAADYMRTAMAKGISFRNAVHKHALRNSLIPIATNVGHQVTLFVGGSFLIERIFDINGFGLLGFQSVLDSDVPVVMGVLMLSAFLMLLGNVLADALVALVDPRVRFD